MKTYLNSLWKWKLSNVEARYYTNNVKIRKSAWILNNMANTLMAIYIR